MTLAPQALAARGLSAGVVFQALGAASADYPAGDLVAGPLWDGEGILVADLDLTAIPRAKFDFDVTGHYARPDVFRLEVDESSKRPVG